MRISFSLLFVIILSLDVFAAPVPTADVGNELVLEVRKAKAAAKKAPKPIAKKVAPKPVAKKVAPKPVAKKVRPGMHFHSAPSSPSNGNISSFSGQEGGPEACCQEDCGEAWYTPHFPASWPLNQHSPFRSAAKKVAAKPAAKKAPETPRESLRIWKKPVAAYKVVRNSFRVQKKPVAKKTGTVAKPPVSKKPVKAAPKPATAPKGAACPIRKKGSKKGSKAGVKARVNSDTENCEGTSAADEGPSAAELCGEITNCEHCVGSGLSCGFDVKDSKCVPETTTGLTLATDKKTCGTLLAAAKQAAAPPAEDERVTAAIKAAAKAAFSTTVQDHIFKGNENKPNSGRHILSAWTRRNPNSVEKQRDTTTGIIEFKVSGCKREIAEKVLKISQNGPKAIKSVWNDLASDDRFAIVYKQDQIKELCLRGYELSVRANTKNAGTLTALAQSAASTFKRGKGRPPPPPPPPPAALQILRGLDNGIVVHNRFINENVCINISSASCFPLGIGTASGKEGDSCTGDGGLLKLNMDIWSRAVGLQQAPPGVVLTVHKRIQPVPSERDKNFAAPMRIPSITEYGFCAAPSGVEGSRPEPFERSVGEGGSSICGNKRSNKADPQPICRDWRAIALGTPKLWATVQISDGSLCGKTELGRAMLIQWMERAGGVPLAVDLCLMWQKNKGSSNAVTELMSRAPRWRDATIQIARQDLVSRPAHPCFAAPPHPYQGGALQGKGQLNYLRVEVAPNLTAVELLRRCADRVRATTISAPGDLYQIYVHSILRSLKLAGDLDMCGKLLPHLKLPPLTSLAIWVGGDDEADDFVSFLPRSRVELQHLDLYYAYYSFHRALPFMASVAVEQCRKTRRKPATSDVPLGYLRRDLNKPAWAFIFTTPTPAALLDSAHE
ncbi:hypothetical protein DFH09DRAFT_1411315 [Mycena vulgaris]|nr:hypothetical protein DFH09DRAFT_1411315 [Mycena vulgaris]